MELYCGGNQVEGVREVGHLRGLPKLIILDLTGNPMAAHDDYRLYTIYHLRKLKVQPCCPFVSADPACRILPWPPGRGDANTAAVLQPPVLLMVLLMVHNTNRSLIGMECARAFQARLEAGKQPA